MMQTTPVCDASLEMYSTTECAAALASPVVGSSRKSTAGSSSVGAIRDQSFGRYSTFFSAQKLPHRIFTREKSNE